MMTMARTACNGLTFPEECSACWRGLRTPAGPFRVLEECGSLLAGGPAVPLVNMTAFYSPAGGHLDHVLANGVLDQLGRTLDLELLHHAVLMKSHGSRCHVQDSRDFLHRLPFCQQLQH